MSKKSIKPSHRSLSELARNALTAYDEALAAIEKLKSQGAFPSGSGGTVFTSKSAPNAFSHYERFSCSECGKDHSETDGWKFCPTCGSEILRFDRPEAKAGTDAIFVTAKIIK